MAACSGLSWTELLSGKRIEEGRIETWTELQVFGQFQSFQESEAQGSKGNSPLHTPDSAASLEQRQGWLSAAQE